MVDRLGELLEHVSSESSAKVEARCSVRRETAGDVRVRSDELLQCVMRSEVEVSLDTDAVGAVERL